MPINYKKYPPNWKTEIRPRILDRANYTCEMNGCEFKHLENVLSVQINGKRKWFKHTMENEIAYPINKLVKVVLTIAHLDHDEDNHNVKDERLAAFCQRCHLAYDAQEKKRRRQKK